MQSLVLFEHKTSTKQVSKVMLCVHDTPFPSIKHNAFSHLNTLCNNVCVLAARNFETSWQQGRVGQASVVT